MADITATAEAGRTKHRSPAYPGINLMQAIQRTRDFYTAEHKNAASFNAAAAHWGFTTIKSSAALVTAAAVKSFGLMDEVESTSGRSFKVSPLGLRIVADNRPESSERDAAIREAALRPKIHAQIWTRYGGRLPSDVELKHILENELNFNVNSINSFMKELRATINFAKLSESGNISGGGADIDKQEETPPAAKVGDFVQWESGGILQFREPKRVRGFSDDGGYLFVDGSNTGVPVREVAVVPDFVPASNTFQIRPTIIKGNANMKQDVFSLSEGDVVLSWPTSLSQDSLDDLKAWLKLMERKISRSLVSDKSATEPDPEV
jgi:hypothetical protein